MALAAYRHVLRATRVAFKGDTTLLQASRQEARRQFLANAHFSPSSYEAASQIAHAEAVVDVLRKNVVQGVKLPGTEAEEEKGGRWRLRIHEETERGDNASVKTVGKGTVGGGGGGCCGGGGR